ncbi:MULTISPECIES: divalent-cation tolerance protein CutA [Desulfosediminicola]|uniref:divalent-cation tolerance protein CutA n=1 Tax=Desulfosediminicola TaxID=2886823 RepID=UPI0015932C3E|nr:divalent-cation tolerance protein CutA [Desulfosediminicola ganghwensis]
MAEALIVTTTLERQEHAEKLARALLDNRLVACAQIHGPVKSLYHWQNDIAESIEFVLSVKTLESLYPEVEALLLEQHPYDVPEIVADQLVKVNDKYLAWMYQELKK